MDSRHSSPPLSSRSRWLTAALIALAVLALAPRAHAQKEEPKPPGEGDDSEAPPTRPVNRVHPNKVEPTPVYSTDPGAASTKAFSPLDWRDAIGVYGRYLFVTEQMLKPYLQSATALNSFAIGAQYTRRFEHFDVVTSLDFSWLVLPDGNWLGAGNDPSLDTKFVQFDKLSFLSADVAIIGHHAFNNWLELRGGAGLGIGVVFGNVLTTSNSNQVCNKDTFSNPAKCYPITAAGTPIMLNQPDTNANLKKTQQSDALDVAQDPHRKKASVPPAMAVVNIQMALNFRLHKHVSAQVEIGFRDALFVGAGVHYHF